MLLKKIVLVFSLVLSAWFSFAQKVDCINVQEVDIPFNTQTFTENTNAEDSYNYNLIYYSEEDEYTFWYKLNIKEDCKLKFAVLPSDPNDDYDFMLFKYADINFCNDFVNNNLTPINNNYYEPSATNNKEKKIVIANQKEINVKKGDTYYISVMNLYGEDCGHQLFIEACNSSIILNTVNKPCFRFAQPMFADNNTTKEEIKPEKVVPTDIPAEEDLFIVADSVIIKGFVRDNDDGKSIDADIIFEDDVTGELFTFHANAKDGFNITLERARRYRLKCNSLGYYSIKGVIEFLKPSTYDFYLLKIKEGENFVMENIYFYPSTYALKEESYKELDKLVTYLSKNPAIKIEIQGHTAGDNPVKSTNPAYKDLGEEWNYIGTAKKLSKLRAEEVKKYLLSKKIEDSRLTTEGFGAENKLIENPINNEEKNKNMRVEVKVTQRERNNLDFAPSSID